MYQLSLSLKSPHKSIITFNDSEKNSINNAFSQMIKCKKMEWSFTLLEKNLNVLFSETDSIFKHLALENNDTWEKIEKIALEINRNLLNYVASQNAYLDHSKHFLSQTFGKDSEQSINFVKLTQTLYTDFFAYRFLYQIRHYTVHCGFSLCGISIKRNKQSVAYIPKFLIKDLLENNFDWKIVKDDLSKIKDDFSAFDVIKESFECFKKLQIYLDEILSKSNEDNRKLILNFLKIEKENLQDYCFLLNYGKEIKISEIPVHYFK